MLKLTTPKSFLRFAKNMTVGELKNVTPQDLMAYKAEFETCIKSDREEDFGVVQESNMKMLTFAVAVYGASSKQHKYLSRNFSKGESLVDLHYNMFPPISALEGWVRNSKTGMYEDYCVPAQNYQRKEGS